MTQEITIIIFFSAVVIAITIIWRINIISKKEKSRQLLVDSYLRLHPKIRKANDNFKGLMSLNNYYFSNYTLSIWKNEFGHLAKEISDKPYKNIKLDPSVIQDIDQFIEYFNKSDQYRKEFNGQFIKQEKTTQKSLLDNILGFSLDDQQRNAVITDEDNCLIIAGAGSGKTTTIAGKVSYLISRYRIDPKDILLISFTVKACEEMKDRIKKKMGIDVDVRTFHKLGLDIISKEDIDCCKSIINNQND